MQPVSVQVTGTRQDTWYSSLILDFQEGGFVQIGVPMLQGTQVPLAAGTPITMDIPQPDGVRRCTTAVVGIEQSPPSLRLQWPQDAQRIQRREAVRVEANFRAELFLRGVGRSLPLPAVSMDISLGGVRLSIKERPDTPLPCMVRLHLPKLGTLEFEGRLLRTGAQNGLPGDGHYWAAVQFTNLPEPMRRDLTRLVFDIEREQMRKGTG